MIAAVTAPVQDVPIGLVVLGVAAAWVIIRLVESAVDAFKALRGQHVRQLSRDLLAVRGLLADAQEGQRRAQMQHVQIEAARQQLEQLLDRARACVAELELVGLRGDTSDVIPGRHGSDTLTTSMLAVTPDVVRQPGLKSPEAKDKPNAAPCAY